jgi:hypothetical protein
MSMKSVLAGVIAIVCMPGLAGAQDKGASIAGNISAFNMDSHTSVAYSGSVDFRFTRVIGLELEATFVPSLKAPYPGSNALNEALGGLTSSAGGLYIGIPTLTLSNEGGRAVIWSNNVRVAIPTTTTRVEPFFVAGGGVANVERTANLNFTSPPIIGIGLPPIGGSRTMTQPLSTSSTAMELTIGGGVGIKAAAHLWIDADLRLIRILGTEDQNAGRFGVDVRYRF